MEMDSDIIKELQTVRRCNRDLLALSALPILWTNSSTPTEIVQSLLSVLLDTLDLDIVFLHLKIQLEEFPIQMIYIPQGLVPLSQMEEWSLLFSPLLQHTHLTSQAVIVPQFPDSNGKHIALKIPIGYEGIHGSLIAASKRKDFPSESERLLLNFGTNQMAIFLERRRA